MIPQPIPTGEAAREAGLASPQRPAGRWSHLLRLFGDYWLSHDWKFAWFGAAVLLLYQFGNAWIMIAGIRWQQAFFDSIEARQAGRFVPLLLVFVGILAAQIVASLVYTWTTMILGMRWRTVLTARYLDRWMARNRYAEIERLRLIDNPDQRIADDIAVVTGGQVNGFGVVNVAFGVIGMVVGSYSLIVVLLETAEPFRFALFGRAVVIPGSTIWYAVLYSLFGSIVVTRIGQPFVRALMRQQHRDADFRASMIQVRRQAAQIGFAGAASVERATLGTAFDQVRHNFRSVTWSLLGINAGQGVYERIGSILPLFLMVPRYFAGAISFGQVMGARDAFQQLVGQLSFIVQIYGRIGVHIACLNRLKALDDAIDQQRVRGISVDAAASGGAVLRTRGLAVHRPDGAGLLDIGDWCVQRGERWIVQGPSGVGKSTLLRAILGLWPDGAGEVSLAAGRAMTVPQRLYLPSGTLKSAVCFPDPDSMHDDAQIVALLDEVGLSAHRDQLHAVRFWQDELSPGEQRRVALARILLHRPELLILDEATSALDGDNARRFHEQLLAALPGVTLISVVHDDALAVFHTHRLVVGNGVAAAAPIGDAA
ncbi:putative ATP-binding cassette transporter [Sphingomonas jinjuensis]|uniref:Putative ATP-binding cassette transporter n=1 Tax=Sphingomonas jinjuensis TaxID=535907 RepID=A0A840FJR5_9SPHN|nr:ATP-binding cassette domain-containing protein [Sphingomonas jinjuensis]MBB4153555.1 putative ATP-binding cassette transporter [Sphingomonas jinjuensis]